MTAERSVSRREGFTRWRRARPFWGALLIALGGIEEFFSGQLDIGEIHIQLGLEGLQAVLIPAMLVLLAVLIVAMPVHRIFYGIIALIVAIYSLVGVNLGGFVIGMVLATVGGIMVVSWMPKSRPDQDADPDAHADADAPDFAGGDEPADQGTRAGRRRRSMRGRTHGTRDAALGIAAVATLVAGSVAAAQPAHAAEESAVKAGCVLLIFCRPDPTPDPTPAPATPTPSAPAAPMPSEPAPEPTAPGDGDGDGGDGTGDPIVEVPGQDRPSHPDPGEEPVTETSEPSDLTTGTPLLALGADNDHGVFTLPSANTSGSTMQIEGLKRVGLVTVPLADGTRATTIRIECDALIMDDFQLDTLNRPEVVDLDTGGMTLRGDVVVWIDRVGTIFDEAGGLANSLDSNPLALEPLMTLLGQGHLVLGLVGAQADELTYETFRQQASKQ